MSLSQTARNLNILLATAILVVPGLARAAVDKVTSSTIQPLQTPSYAIAADALLDVGIPPLNDGLHLTDEDDTVFPEVRYAEAIYFSNQLAKTMEKSGAWGAIRVTPNADVVMDVYVTGTILQSDGETLDLEIRVYDTSGRQWLDERYTQVTGKYAYDRRLKNIGDPFQNLFTRIANDVLAARERLSDEQAARLRQISELRFARDFSPEAFNEHISRDKKGMLTIERLPAENDSILERVNRIRERDYLYVDTMQDYYDVFSQRMHLAYQDFRRASYDSVVKARQLKKQGNRRIIAGIGSILAGIYGRYEGDSYYARDAGTALAATGGWAIKSGLEKKAEAASHTEAVAEMGSSLEAEIAPQVIELEDRTVTLDGTVQAQYEQWRELLKQIYDQERGGT
ncbi:MAG: hypothetical protein GWM87_04125 [Xanthomonadales bacterium]|nr:hypothetical protein [Xanthomonadales bacterium]NIX12213.1 hypothetical protein [Xanthomonadales bacterium]